MTLYVQPARLDELMDHAATLGVAADRNLSAIGEQPPGDAPDARLSVYLYAFASTNADIRIETDDPAEAAELLRERVESFEGSVASRSESRNGDDYVISLTLVVQASHLRDLLEYADTLGDADDWNYTASGLSPETGPSAQLIVTIEQEDDPRWYLILMLALVAAALAFSAIYAALKWQQSRRRSESPPATDAADEPDEPDDEA